MVAAALNGFYNVYLKSRGQNLTLTVNNNPLPRNLDSQVDKGGREGGRERGREGREGERRRIAFIFLLLLDHRCPARVPWFHN